MQNVLRIALPGFNALTETDPNNFALDADTTTNILIKENARGKVTIPSGNSTVITHNLGYVPLFLCFVYDTINSVFRYVGSGGAVSAPTYEAYSDTTQLTIVNNSANTTSFWYYVFYDNINGVSNNTIAFTSPTLRVALSGKNALTSTDPNDFKYHSDFNTFKIIAQGSHTFSITSGSHTYSVAHGATNITPLFLAYIKFPDGLVTPLIYQQVLSYNNAANGVDAHSADDYYWDSTNLYITINNVVTGYSVDVVWFQLEPELT